MIQYQAIPDLTEGGPFIDCRFDRDEGPRTVVWLSEVRRLFTVGGMQLVGELAGKARYGAVHTGPCCD